MTDKKPCELSDLPVEMQQMLVEKCDLITRSKLSASSHSMKNVVASTKLFIPCVKLKELTDEGVLLKLTIKLFKDEYTVKFKKDNSGGTRIYQAFKKETVLSETSPVKEAMNLFERMCLQKNITIGQLQVDIVGINEELKKQFEELIQKKNIHLKIKYVYWYSPGPIDLFWKIMEFSDKTHLKELKVVGKTPEGGFNLFGEHDEILNNLEKIEVECDTNAKDENIRSLKASSFNLKSPHFTPELASHLIEKFTNERSKGSNFHIKASPITEIGSCNIPRGFEEVEGVHEYSDYFNQLPDNKMPIVLLRINETSVRLQVGNSENSQYWEENEFIEPPEYDDELSEYDIYDDFDDLENDYYGNGFDTDPDYDLYAQRGLHESDFEDDDEDDEEDYY